MSLTQPRLLDTDALSFYLKGDDATTARAKLYVEQHGKLAFSIITYYEITRGLKAAKLNAKLDRFKKFAAQECHLTPLDTMVLDIATDIYAALANQGRLLADADILIAACAMHEKRILVTNNIKHFERIVELKIESWSHSQPA